MQPTFVLVHGAFADSFSFASLQAELGLLGHRSVAVDLPGHGFAATCPHAYQAPQGPEGLAATPGAIKGVILAAHSRGGITATAAMSGQTIDTGPGRDLYPVPTQQRSPSPAQ